MADYVEIEKFTEIGETTCMEWKSVDEFEHYIRSIAPKGKIVGISGRGYEGFDGSYAPTHQLNIVITTTRLKSVVEREEAIEAERSRKAQEAAAAKAAQEAARKKEAELKHLLRQANQRLKQKRTEIEKFFAANPHIPRGGSDGNRE